MAVGRKILSGLSSPTTQNALNGSHSGRVSAVHWADNFLIMSESDNMAGRDGMMGALTD